MSAQEHWERVYEAKAPHEVSWFRPHLEIPLAMIERAAGDRSAAIIDIGGGASTLADDLIDRGYSAITVLDISQRAIDAAKARLGGASAAVHWLRADITRIAFPARAFSVWHDRAVFHFLTKKEDRLAYVRAVEAAVKPGGRVMIGAFALEGPSKCSGLDVVRYSSEWLHAELGPRFQLLETLTELHKTPSGATQQFLYCCYALDT